MRHQLKRAACRPPIISKAHEVCSVHLFDQLSAIELKFAACRESYESFGLSSHCIAQRKQRRGGEGEGREEVIGGLEQSETMNGRGGEGGGNGATSTREGGGMGVETVQG